MTPKKTKAPAKVVRFLCRMGFHRWAHQGIKRSTGGNVLNCYECTKCGKYIERISQY